MVGVVQRARQWDGCVMRTRWECYRNFRCFFGSTHKYKGWWCTKDDKSENLIRMESQFLLVRFFLFRELHNISMFDIFFVVWSPQLFFFIYLIHDFFFVEPLLIYFRLTVVTQSSRIYVVLVWFTRRRRRWARCARSKNVRGRCWYFFSMSFTFGSMIGWRLKMQAHTKDCRMWFFGDDKFFFRMLHKNYFSWSKGWRKKINKLVKMQE